jgi:hypothetical protein
MDVLAGFAGHSDRMLAEMVRKNLKQATGRCAAQQALHRSGDGLGIVIPPECVVTAVKVGHL